MATQFGGTRLPEYDIARNRISQQQNAQRDEAQDALTRRYARLGGLNSGSYIKQAQLQDNSLNQQRNDALQEVDLSEAGALRQQAEIEAGRKYQTSEREAGQLYGTREREGSQGFAQGQMERAQLYGTREREAGQAYGTREREGAQGFASGEAEKGRGFQRELVDKDLAFKDKVFNFEKTSKLRQMDMADKEFAADQRTTEFNKFISILGLSQGESRTSSLRAIIEDPNTTPAAKAAAYQYLAGSNEIYMSSEQANRIRSGQLSREGAVRENQALFNPPVKPSISSKR